MEFSTSPTNIERLINSRNAALKFKHGSPKFRDVLRERCRKKVKENRQKFIDLLRSPSSSENLNRALTDTICEEVLTFSALDRDKNKFEITNDKWLDEKLQELEQTRENNFLEELDDEVEQVLFNCDALLANEDHIAQLLLENEVNDLIDCPVCGEGYIVLSYSHISCTECSMMIASQTDLHLLDHKIQSGIREHSYFCQRKPLFIVAENSLKLTCDQCLCSQIIFQ